MLWHQNSGAKPLPLNSGAMAFLVPNSILLTWHHFWSLAPRVWHQKFGTTTPCALIVLQLLRLELTFVSAINEAYMFMVNP
ncbi:hypothetical protein Tco_1208472, partial [Tanacetum coccineum]